MLYPGEAAQSSHHSDRGKTERIVFRVHHVQQRGRGRRSDPLSSTTTPLQGPRPAVVQALAIINAAIDRYKELCEGKYCGKAVDRMQNILGVDFFYSPPPRSAVPFAASLRQDGMTPSKGPLPASRIAGLKEDVVATQDRDVLLTCGGAPPRGHPAITALGAGLGLGLGSMPTPQHDDDKENDQFFGLSSAAHPVYTIQNQTQNANSLLLGDRQRLKMLSSTDIPPAEGGVSVLPPPSPAHPGPATPATQLWQCPPEPNMFTQDTSTLQYQGYQGSSPWELMTPMTEDSRT